MALVTGGARGIGRAIAGALAAAGATTAITYREQAQMAVEAVRDIEAGGPAHAAAYQLDVRDHERVKAVLAEVQDAHGPIAILVNNAGVVRDNYLRFMKQDEWTTSSRQISPVRFLRQSCAAGYAAGQVGSHHQSSSGCRLASAMCVVRTMPRPKPAYSVSRAAPAREVAGHGITVNAIRSVA